MIIAGDFFDTSRSRVDNYFFTPATQCIAKVIRYSVYFYSEFLVDRDIITKYNAENHV